MHRLSFVLWLLGFPLASKYFLPADFILFLAEEFGDWAGLLFFFVMFLAWFIMAAVLWTDQNNLYEGDEELEQG